MVATFILTRTFAISALFVGAFDLAYAAPVPLGADVVFEPRNCRTSSCMRSLPVELVDSPDVPAVRDVGPEARSVLDNLLERLTTTPGDALADRNLGEPASFAHEVSRTVDFESREPIPEPRPDDTNCRDGGCEDTVDLESRAPVPAPKPDDDNCRDGGCS